MAIKVRESLVRSHYFLIRNDFADSCNSVVYRLSKKDSGSKKMSMNAAQTSKFGKALYYPYIEIQDVNWLKLALLYWDGLRRIVPNEAVFNDNEDVREVIDAGFLESTPPDKYRRSASEKFLTYFRPLVENSNASSLLKVAVDSFSNKELQRFHLQHIVSQLTANNDGWDIKEIFSHLVSSVSAETVKLYGDKAEIAVFDELKFHGLAKKSGDCYHIHGIIGGFYMMCLAAEMSEKIGTPLVTDSPQLGSCGEYISFGKPGNPSQPQAEELHGVLVKLNIPFPTPEELKDVSIKDILKFREQRKDERKRFRKAIESITVEASTISDPNQRKDFFSSQGEEIKSAIEDHRRVLDELNVKTFSSLLSVSAPTAIATAAGLAVPPVAMAMTGMGIGISLVNWWAEVRKERREKTQASPWHYLLSIKQLT